MRKFWLLVTVAVLTLTMVAGCVGEAEEVVKTYTVREQLINIGINEKFIIHLDCGAEAEGFDWQANYDTAMLKLVDSRFEANGEGEPKAAGTKWFKFKVLKMGETEISMVYVRWFVPPGGIHFGEGPMGRELLGRKVFTVNIK